MKGIANMKEKLDIIKIYPLYFVLFSLIVLTNDICIEKLNGIAGIVIGCLWMVVSILFYVFYLGKHANTIAVLIYALINAVVSGACTASYYTLKNVKPFKAEELILVFALLLAVNMFISLIIKKSFVFAALNLAVTILLLCLTGYIWIVKDKTAGSGLFFMLIVYLCFSIARFIMVKREESWIKLISLSTLLMFGGILLVVLTAISDGDILEALEIVPDVTGPKKAGK